MICFQTSNSGVLSLDNDLGLSSLTVIPNFFALVAILIESVETIIFCGYLATTVMNKS